MAWQEVTPLAWPIGVGNAVLVSISVLVFLLVGRIRYCAARPPHFTIGNASSVYMRRWYVIPRNRLFNIYLHEIRRSDDDRALHDHPWVNVSIVLKGRYREIMPLTPPTEDHTLPYQIEKWRTRGSIVLRRPTAAHRLEIEDGKPCWSLFITGPNVRTWGFWCPRGWKPWQQFVDMSNTGAVGPGCGES
jgi:hypothetical protein